jgi:Periplasmic copper-binding protein (NosD)
MGHNADSTGGTRDAGKGSKMNHVCTTLLGGILVLGSLGSSWGATLTVRPGEDLRSAAQRLRGGDTMLILAGEYEGGIGCEIPSGTEGAPTIIRAATPKQAVIKIRGGGRGFDLGAGGCSQSWIVIDGFTITGENQRTGEGIHLTNTSHVTVQNTDIKNILGNGTCAPSLGIGFSNANGNTFRGNRLYNLGQNDPPPEVRSCNFTYGTYLPSNGNIWENNIFADISAFAIHGYPSPEGNVIRHNALCRTGPLLMRGSGNMVTDNLLYKVGETVYPFERGQTIMVSDGNTSSGNRIVDSDSICNTIVQAPLPPGHPRPRVRHLRIITR